MSKKTRTGPEPAQPARGNFTPPPYDAAPATTPASGQATPPVPSGSRLSPRNWRVRTRLNAILLIPVLVALIVGGFNVKNSVDQWQQADDALRTAKLVRAAATYSNDLINERDVSVVPLLKGDTKNAQVTSARQATDQAAKDFNAAVAQMPDSTILKRRVATFRKAEPSLAGLRQAAYTSKLPGVETEEGYVLIQHPLMEFANDLGFGTNNLTSYGRNLYSVELAKAAESLTRSIGEHILSEGSVPASERKTQLTALASYAYLERIALEEYQAAGTPEDMTLLQQANADAQKQGQQQLAAAKQQAQASGQPFVAPPDRTTMVQDIASDSSTSALKAQGITPESFFGSTTLAFDAYRNVEQSLSDQASTDAASLASSAKDSAVVDSAAVLAGVLLAFVFAALMARSMSNSMRRLRTSAFEVAEQQLPALVDQLSRTDPGRVDTRVTPIPINSNDEIGEVARAFDQVHREAVRLAAEQALLRGNVNAIFTNLSLRNQGLIQRQLSLITDLENNEADPDQLDNLFHLDHLATRMRRNGENLLVLAGEEPGRRWNQPVPLVDVLRAAASEVESYERIEISGVPETEIHGSTVTDLVHLLAELLENATSFSSPQTKVHVTATRLPDGRVMVEIHDSGIGLTAEDFADINHKLADPPTVDASVSQRMGLFVVGRLAARHGIRVQLRPSGERAGTTSLVMLPEAITHGGGGGEQFDDDFTVSRIVPEHTSSDGYQGGQLTAAELGFDDKRYDIPDDARELDPVGRSLMREERRAALERRQQEGDHRPLFRDEVTDSPAEAPDTARASDPYAAYEGYGDQETYGEYERAPEQGREQEYAEGYGPDYSREYEPEYGRFGGDGDGNRDGNGDGPGYERPRDGEYADYAETEYPQSEHPEHRGFGFPRQPSQPSYEAAGDHQAWGLDYRQDPGNPWSAADPEPEIPTQPQERVGYDAPDAERTDGTRPLTDAGLPRRDRQWQQPEAAEPRPEPAAADAGAAGPEGLHDGVRGEDQGGQDDAAPWRSANDEHWERAEQAREPKAGGVTASGLPRRVPRANLVPGAAHQTPQGGPQVSRAPEAVRGRLSNLRRGVQQGRGAGNEATSTPTDSQGLGPNHQER